MCKGKRPIFLSLPPFIYSSHSFPFSSVEENPASKGISALFIADSDSYRIPVFCMVALPSLPTTYCTSGAAVSLRPSAVHALPRGALTLLWLPSKSATESHPIIVHHLSLSWILYKWAQCSAKPQVAKWAKQNRMTHIQSSCLLFPDTVGQGSKQQAHTHTHTRVFHTH